MVGRSEIFYSLFTGLTVCGAGFVLIPVYRYPDFKGGQRSVAAVCLDLHASAGESRKLDRRVPQRPLGESDCGRNQRRNGGANRRDDLE